MSSVPFTKTLRLVNHTTAQGAQKDIWNTHSSRLDLFPTCTHVAAGSIADVGARAKTKTLNGQVLYNVLLSWAATLPPAAVVAWSIVQLI